MRRLGHPLDEHPAHHRLNRPGASETVVGRLDGDATGRLLLQVPLFAAPAACWWARQTMESTFTFQVIRPFALA